MSSVYLSHGLIVESKYYGVFSYIQQHDNVGVFLKLEKNPHPIELSWLEVQALVKAAYKATPLITGTMYIPQEFFGGSLQVVDTTYELKFKNGSVVDLSFIQLCVLREGLEASLNIGWRTQTPPTTEVMPNEQG